MAMTYRSIRFDVDDRVAVITLDRPEARNAFTGAMGEELADAYRVCDADDEIGAVVLTGTPPAFCAGADLSAGADTFRVPEGDGFSASAVPMRAWDVRKLVIAAVNGHALGLGLTLALQCDIRIFAADAAYGVVQVRRGMMGDAYSHWTLPRIAGMSAAADILLTGRTFDGHEARELGICSRTLAADEVLPAAVALARDVAVNAAPLSVAASKQLLWESWDKSAAQVEEAETERLRTLMSSADVAEGVLAFVEKRPPQWRGSVSRDLPGR
jgi:enoyl-CoA hydratase/carnithine racemase